jgi:RIO kinase 1
LKNVDEFWSRRGVKTLGLRASFDFVVRDDLAGGGVEGEAVVKEETVLRDLIKNRIDGPEPDQPSTSQPTDQNSNTVNSASTAPTKTNETAAQSHQEDQIFLKSYIPRSLNEVYDPERDIEIGEKKDVYQGFIRGPGQTEEGDERGEVRFDGAVGGEGSESDEDEEDDSDEEGEDGEGREDRKPRGHRHEDKDAKKVRYNLFSLCTLPVFSYYWC